MLRTKNPQYNQWKAPEGFTELGWQLHRGNSKEIKECQDKDHKIKEFDNSLYQLRGTDVIYYCDECKIFWHIDMSD